MGVSRARILPRLQAEVGAAVLEGATADEVNERIIDPAPLGDEEKAALWLFAWSLMDPVYQRSEARRHLIFLEGASDEE